MILQQWVLPDPSAVIAHTAATQRQSKPQKSKAAADSYAAAVTGKSSTPPAPIGAKAPSAKASAKSAGGAIGAPITGKASAKSDGGAIGAPIIGKAKAKSSVDNPPTGAAQTSKQDPAMDSLTHAPANQSFADFQAAQSAQGTQDAQAALDAQTAQDVLTAQTVQA